MKEIFKKLEMKKWNIEHFDGYPAFTEMTAAGFTRKMENTNLLSYRENLCFYRDDQGDWMSLFSEHKKIGSLIITKHLKDKKFLGKIYEAWLGKFSLMMEKYYLFFEEDLKKMDDADFKKWIENLYEFYREKVSMPGFIDGFMFYADKRFDGIVREFCEKNKMKDYPKIFSILSAPTESSFINEEEADLKKIFKIKNKEKQTGEIKKHLKKYSWIKSSYAGYKKYSLVDIKKEIRQIAKNINKGGEICRKNKIDKDELLKKYKFTPEIIAIAEIAELLTIWQDKRKVYTLTFASLQSKILREIERRFGIDFDILKYSRLEDVVGIFNGKIKLAELKKRKKASVFYYSKGGVSGILTDKDALNFFKKVSEIEIGSTQELSGMSASLGKASGKVKVIKSIKDLGKIKSGDILVAAMTRSEYLAGMKKASAIITDDGGITCHAAIVSRELQIPCIIGTKIATKVLKDGDLVEVDANKGMVKILKKK